MQPRTPCLLIALALLGLPLAARADIILLKNGRRLQGKTIKVGGKVRIQLKLGAAVIVERSQIVEIRPGTWRDEYLRRAALLKTDDAPGHYRLAVWCRNHNLLREHSAELAAVLAADSKHAGALTRQENLRIERQQTRLSKAAATEQKKSAKPATPATGGLRRATSEHVVALSDGAPDSAEKIAAAAEEVIGELAALLSVPENSPRLRAFRVRVRYYRKREDYMAVARRAGVTSNAGFYSSGRATCHVIGKPDGSLGPQNLRTVRHETVHAFLWKVMLISSADPWLHEGLATLMESKRKDRFSKSRLWFLAAYPQEARLNIEGLYASQFKSGAINQRLINYARTWSFTHFMFCSGDARRLETYLKCLQASRGWRTNPRKILEKHFPDHLRLAAAWRAHVNELIAKHLPRRMRTVIPTPDTSWEAYRRKLVSPRRSGDSKR